MLALPGSSPLGPSPVAVVAVVIIPMGGVGEPTLGTRSLTSLCGCCVSDMLRKVPFP